MGIDPESPSPENGNNNKDLSGMSGPKEAGIFGASPAPQTIFPIGSPAQTILNDFRCTPAIVNEDEALAIDELRASVRREVGLEEAEGLESRGIVVNQSRKPLRSATGELMEIIDVFDGSSGIILIPDLDAISSPCPTGLSVAAARAPERFQILSDDERYGVCLLASYDLARGCWKLSLASSERFLEQLVDNYLSSVDKDLERPLSGSATALGYFVDELIGRELRRMARSAGLRGDDVAEAVGALRIRGIGLLLRPEYEVSWADDGSHCNFSVIYSMPGDGGFVDPDLQASAVAFDLRVSINRVSEVDLQVVGRRDLGPAVML